MSGQPRNLSDLPYYYTNFRSSEEVKHYLSAHRNRPGSYILRPSFSKANCYSISVVLNGGDVRHLNIHVDASSGHFFLVADTKFRSIPNLVEHYALNPVHNEEQVTDVRFLYPVTHRRLSRTERRATEPSLHIERSREEGSASRRVTHSNSLNVNGGTAADFARNRVLSTRSEGGGSRESGLRRSPLDKLPTLPIDGEGPSVKGRSLSLTDRPPASLPGQTQGHIDYDYSQPREADLDMSNQLKEALRLVENPGYCDCGLPLEESQLPEGWSVHQTPPSESGAPRRIFFQSPEGQTFWEPPESLVQLLTHQHVDNIKKLREICARGSTASQASTTSLESSSQTAARES